LIDRYAEHGELLRDDRERESIETELLGGLAQEFAARDIRYGRSTKPRRMRALYRAIEYAEIINQPIPVPELSRAAGVSQRTLENAFRETFGISPAKYLRWHRMNHLYRDLLAAEPRSMSITATASRYGFSELGRLAVEYRQLFGESPSATVAKQKPSPSVRLKDLLASN
jgi:transcriptional regulator GlxA family with amidase domain